MKLPRLVILLALALAGAAVSSASASAAPGFFGHHHQRPPVPPRPQESPVVGHAYVNDNTAISNTVAGFNRHADGSLTPIPGSPFVTGGAGSGAGLPSQGAIQLSSDGRYLLAVDAASNQISVLGLGFGGVPQPVGAPVSSGGSDPVSIAVSGNLVYVANAGAGEPNVTGFRLGWNGVLSPLPSSTVALPAGSGPDDVLFDPTGQRLVVPLVNASTIASFHVGWDGRLIAAPGSPFAAQGPGPFGSEFRPTNPSQLFVSNAHGGEGNGTVSAFNVNFSGELTSIGSSPFADLQTAPMLGGDQPRRTVSVHREHRVGRDLQLRDHPQWLAGANRQHAVRLGRSGRRRRAPVPRRQDAAGQRQQGRRDRLVRRQRRQPHRASELTHTAARRRRRRGHRRRLTRAERRRPGVATGPAAPRCRGREAPHERREGAPACHLADLTSEPKSPTCPRWASAAPLPQVDPHELFARAPRSLCDAPQVSYERCDRSFHQLPDEAGALSEQVAELPISHQREIDRAPRSLTDRPDKAVELAQARVPDDENIYVAIRSPGTRRPRAVDHRRMNVGTIEASAQLALHTDRTTQEIGERRVGGIVCRSREPVRPRLVLTTDDAGPLCPGQLPMNR